MLQVSLRNSLRRQGIGSPQRVMWAACLRSWIYFTATLHECDRWASLSDWQRGQLQGQVAEASSTSIRAMIAQSKYKILQSTIIRDIISFTNSPIRSLLQGGLLGTGQSLHGMESDLHTRPTPVLNCVM